MCKLLGPPQSLPCDAALANPFCEGSNYALVSNHTGDNQSASFGEPSAAPGVVWVWRPAWEGTVRLKKAVVAPQDVSEAAVASVISQLDGLFPERRAKKKKNGNGVEKMFPVFSGLALVWV